MVPILEALRVLKENNIPHGDIQIVFSVCEEGGLNGSKNIDSSLLKAGISVTTDLKVARQDHCDCARTNKINVKVHGKTAHAGLEPEKALMPSRQQVEFLLMSLKDVLMMKRHVIIGIISGGLATNIVPDLVEIKCEARRNQENWIN